jgi:hypothetical protein
MTVASARPRHHRARYVVHVGLVAILSACTPAASAVTSPSPSGPPGGGGDPARWAQLPNGSVEQAPELDEIPTDAKGSLPPCAECQAGAYATMTGVAVARTGLVAVGWISPDFHGAAWTSADGSSWSLAPRLAEGTGFTAVAADADRIVAVGLDGRGATAWSSTEGLAWQKTTSAAAFAQAPSRLTAVVHWRGGFAAAGYEGNEFGAATAAFWVSPDGLSWQRAPDSPGLADGRPWSIAAGGPGLVAVGASGSTDAPGPAVVWTSADGLSWARIPADPALADAQMRAVADVAGIGLVAAGEDPTGTGVIWISADGRRWQRASATGQGDQRTKVRLTAVIAGGPGVVVIGSATESTQSTAAAVWTSADGVTWTREASGVEFSYSELAAVARWRDGLVAVGDTGIPDEYIASVWTSPPAWSR